ncbi:hypothetical protein IJ098_02590 [Candidatus Saccharibacteria bacterium]|nr:hypothetical protein [Candidatus Saccharibacteria bacterium]
MSNNKEDNGYIEIVYEAQEVNQHALSFLIYFGILCFCCWPAGIVGTLTNSIAAVITTIIILYLPLFFLVKKHRKKAKEAKAAKCGETRREVSIRTLAILEDVLDREGDITASTCAGFITTPSMMKKIYAIPLYGASLNPPVHEENFIRVSTSTENFSRDEKKAIEEAFGYTDKDDVIWFTQRDIVKTAAASTVQALSFVDKKGKRMFFMHTRYSNFINYQRLVLKNNCCVIYKTV